MRLIMGVIIALICLIVFIAIAEDVHENDVLVQVDQAIANELHHQGANQPNAIAFYKVISAVGLPGVWVMGVAVALLFAMRRQWHDFGIWTITLVGGILLNNIIKLIFARSRPVFSDPFVLEQNYSFPSGHAMMAVIGFGFLAYVLVASVKNPIVKIFIVFALTLLIVLIGISRMALGVHYFSDVVGGYAAGGAWLAMCITSLEQMGRRTRFKGSTADLAAS